MPYSAYSYWNNIKYFKIFIHGNYHYLSKTDLIALNVSPNSNQTNEVIFNKGNELYNAGKYSEATNNTTSSKLFKLEFESRTEQTLFFGSSSKNDVTLIIDLDKDQVTIVTKDESTTYDIEKYNYSGFETKNESWWDITSDGITTNNGISIKHQYINCKNNNQLKQLRETISNSKWKKPVDPNTQNFNAATAVVKASQMSTVDMMSYLSRLNMQNKTAVAKEICRLMQNTQLDTKTQSKYKLMVDILKADGVDWRKISNQ